MAVGRISGPLLKANLLRNGINLAFETDLLYLDVINGRVGINTTTPSHDLTINGTTRTTYLETTTQADIATFTLNTNVIASSSSIINLEPSGSNPVVYQAKLVVDNLRLSTNLIETTGTNTDLEIRTTGTGNVNINANVLVTGNVHTTGNITADGNITIGDSNTDNINFKADIASNINPDLTNTYNLGSNPTSGGQAWKTAYINDVQTTNLTTTTVNANGIDLLLPQGNIIYVSKNGSNSYSGTHENNPYLTIKYALSQAIAGDTIFIYPGTYQEILPLTIPVGVTVKGSGLRSVIIIPTPATVDKDVFLLNGEVTIEDLTISDFVYNNINNTGYAFKFTSGFKVTSRSPYIRNVSVLTKGSVTSTSDPYGYDSNDSGKGVFLDGSVADLTSKEASCLFHSVTFITPNQETLIATNGVRIEFLNCFTYFSDKGIYAYSSSAGFANAGLTRLRIPTEHRTGSFNVGDTLTYYDTDGTTVLASGTINSVDSNYINLTGRCIGFESLEDRRPKQVFANGNAHLTTSDKKYGTASLALDGTGDFLVVSSQPDFYFGSNNFTIEMWIKRVGNPGTNQLLVDMRTNTPQVTPVLYLSTTNALSYVVNGATVITGGVISTDWTHIALSKNGNSTKLFINGIQTGSTYTDNNSYIQSPVRIGSRYDGTNGFNGYIDDLKISNGVSRYNSTFTVSTSEATGDESTVLLLHFNGTDNSTAIADSGVTLQNLKVTGSATGSATIIDFADYSDFGAEIRCIGCANNYGQYGVYGDGIGVIIYLIGHNFSYIGSGKDSTNTPHPEGPEWEDVDPYEITKLNNAKIYYTSINDEGDFRVGDNFYVDQKSGEVLFNNQELNIQSLQGVTFTDGTHTTIVTSTDITTGNIKISGNTIESLTGDINVTAANGEIHLKNDTYITGKLDVTGDVTIGGNIILGDQTTDTVTFVAGINSDLIPATTQFYDLGTSSLRWNTGYLSRIEIDNLVIDSNTISTTYGNDDLQLIANGTGRIYIPSNNVKIDQNLTVDTNLTVTTGTTYLKNTGITGTITQTGDLNQTGNFTTSGTAQVTGNITGTGYAQFPNIRIEGNTISTTTTNTDMELIANGTGNVVIEGIKVSDNNIQSIVTNSNITLTPQGSGGVIINSNKSLQVPVGTTLERPTSPTNGMVRYNTTLSRYEGYNNGYWLQLSGVIDNSGNTRILAEATPGANDNILYFYANNNLTATIDSNKLTVQRFHTTNLDINGNIITPLSNNTDINLTGTGTGGIRIGNLKIYNNSIINVVSGEVTEFTQSGAGYVRIPGTNGVVIPSGDTFNDRPPNPALGMIRFNTYEQYVEVYNGISWSSVAGSSSGVTILQTTDIGLASALIFG